LKDFELEENFKNFKNLFEKVEENIR